MIGHVPRYRREAFGGQQLGKLHPPVKSKAAQAQPLFLAKSATEGKIGSVLSRIRSFFNGASAANEHVASTSAPPPRQVKGTASAGDASPRVTINPLREAAAKFQSFFPGGIPPLADVLAKRGRNPEAFEVCRNVLQGSQFLVVLDCMAALDELRSNPSIDKAREIRDRFIQDPKDDDVFDLNASGADKLNLYQDAYKNFTRLFNAAEKELQEADTEAGRQRLLDAFDQYVQPTLTKDSRYFRSNVEALLKEHGQPQVSLPFRPDPGRFA